MPKIRNKTDGERFLSVPGLECMVQPGEIVDAPDFQLDGVSPLVYPSATWELVSAKDAKAADKAAAADMSATADTSGKAAG